jgi:hypothetical protein
MKKAISLLFLLFVGVSVYAQKSYITVTGGGGGSGGGYYYLTGNISDDLVDLLDLEVYNDYGGWVTNKKTNLDKILNLLSAKGYEVEFALESWLLLTNKSEGSSSSEVISSSIQKIRANNDSEPYEVARYNLQGMLVKETEKGIQIIVYSNYTIKTVIVE